MTDRIQEMFAGRTILCDGAMGTMLYARGVFINRCYDELNLSQPDLVRSVHEEYLQAGAEIIETNTFGANSLPAAALWVSGQGLRRSTRRARIWRGRRSSSSRTSRRARPGWPDRSVRSASVSNRWARPAWMKRAHAFAEQIKGWRPVAGSGRRPAGHRDHAGAE